MSARWWLLIQTCVVLALALVHTAHAFTRGDANVLEQFTYVGDSHYEFGFQLGSRFKDKIHDRIRVHTQLQQRILPYYATEAGKALYASFLESHERTFPDYVDEIRGIAEGSDTEFETLFLLNLVEEFGDAIPTAFVTTPATEQKVLRCSDIVLTAPHLRVVTHNEDSGASDVNRTAMVTAQIGDAPKFVAFTYLGDLPTGAFGFNSHGIAFSLNFVQPSDTLAGGLGRGFISRDLLAAIDTNDAIQRITRPGQAAGHNYQLMDVQSQRIWGIEVASFDRFAVHEFTVVDDQVSAFFHANQYQYLDIPQPPYQSSLHRLRRYSELTPPTTVDEALAILGDQHDRLYPIFHDTLSHERGDLSGWTLITVVFDLLAGQVFTIHGNPTHEEVGLLWDLTTLGVSMIQ
ncbi:TPA: hypothetical protein N0F65_007144 [Lagenidium giganteum]|uniref:Peptidase C45 hydrolase domain-containing protein n=1 Tax=Lagenidium giganteum TaxID=4803 RepID=A0AAV2YYU4_9STRA|nr:TPA: hypothetical protein N0F65_007144 [Lagenidium giganteum]